MIYQLTLLRYTNTYNSLIYIVLKHLKIHLDFPQSQIISKASHRAALANNLQLRAQPVWGRRRMSLHCGRKLEDPERSHTAAGRTRNTHNLPARKATVRTNAPGFRHLFHAFFNRLLFIAEHCAVHQISSSFSHFERWFIFSFLFSLLIWLIRLLDTCKNITYMHNLLLSFSIELTLQSNVQWSVWMWSPLCFMAAAQKMHDGAWVQLETRKIQGGSAGVSTWSRRFVVLHLSRYQLSLFFPTWPWKTRPGGSATKQIRYCFKALQVLVVSTNLHLCHY